jgi:hypothetical protein
MDLGNPLQVGIIAERKFHHRLNLPVPAHDGGWIISFRDHPDVVILDPQLKELQRLDLQAQSQQYCATSVAMSRDSRLLALSTRTDLRIVNRRGDVLHRISHQAWESFAGSSCFFDLKDRLWYVRPGDKPGTNDRLTIIDPNSGAMVAEQIIQNEIGHFELFPCPDHESALIDVGCGQDGSFLYLARLTGGGLTLQRYPFSDRTFYGGFSPDGQEFATGAHQGDAIKIHSFPSGRVIASIESEKIFAADDLVGEGPDVVGYQAIFLNDDLLLAETRFGRMLLINRRKMQLVGTVWPPGYRLRGYDESGKETDEPSKILDYEGGLTSLHPVGVGRVLSVYNEGVIRLLDVSPLLFFSTAPA